MSTDENKAVAERLLQAFNDRDFDAAEQLLSPDFVNHNPPPFPGFTEDRDSMLRAMRGAAAGFPDARATVLNVVAEGDLVVLHDSIRGRHDGEFMGMPPTGNEAEWEFIHIFRVADGKIVERWGLIDALGLLLQLGVMSSPYQAPAGAPS